MSLTSILKSLLGSQHERAVKQMRPLVDEINQIAEEYRQLSDEELKGKTAEFKAYIAEKTGPLEAAIAEARAEKARTRDADERDRWMYARRDADWRERYASDRYPSGNAYDQRLAYDRERERFERYRDDHYRFGDRDYMFDRDGDGYPRHRRYDPFEHDDIRRGISRFHESSSRWRGSSIVSPRDSIHDWRSRGRPSRTSTPWGPLVSYTRTGDLPPDSAISRIGTRTPRGPSTSTLRDPGNASS